MRERMGLEWLFRLLASEPRRAVEAIPSNDSGKCDMEYLEMEITHLRKFE